MRFEQESITSLFAKVLVLLANGRFGMEEWDINSASKRFCCMLILTRRIKYRAHYITGQSGLDGDTLLLWFILFLACFMREGKDISLLY